MPFNQRLEECEHTLSKSEKNRSRFSGFIAGLGISLSVALTALSATGSAFAQSDTQSGESAETVPPAPPAVDDIPPAPPAVDDIPPAPPVDETPPAPPAVDDTPPTPPVDEAPPAPPVDETPSAPPVVDESPPTPPVDDSPVPGVPPADQESGAETGDQGGNAAGMEPGEAFHTRFSGITTTETGNTIIDLNGVVGSIIGINSPGVPANGSNWQNAPHRANITASQVGQVFGIALDNANPPNIYVTATSAFGLHSKNGTWMAGMWGADGGPGTIYRLSAANGYLPEIFANVELNGRKNTGAGLGNIAFDKKSRQLIVSDLETGMIHRFGLDGQALSSYDHGLQGRVDFFDAQSGGRGTLQPVGFDPQSNAQLNTCEIGSFDKTPACWNFADFRRRVWGVGVRQDSEGKTRVYYAVWASDGFGNPQWQAGNSNARTSVWSVGLTQSGEFDAADVRREFVVPEFFPFGTEKPGSGASHAVTDIAFSFAKGQSDMIIAERGAAKNSGLSSEQPFSNAHESRVLRYRLDETSVWRPVGRYDVGFRLRQNEPQMRSNAGGGVDFGYSYTDGTINLSRPSGTVWMSGDALCSPAGPCTSAETGSRDDTTQVHGITGTPRSLSEDDSSGQTNPPRGPLASYMIDSDVDGADRDDTTRPGDVEVYKTATLAPLPIYVPPEIPIDPPIEILPPETGHEIIDSHYKWASSAHWRPGSWHSLRRSWHLKRRSYHRKLRSWHIKRRTFHAKPRSWHIKGRTFHIKPRSWHIKRRTFHRKPRSWHRKPWTFHSKPRSWHIKSRTFHLKPRSWHRKGRTFHAKPRSWHFKGRTFHRKPRSWHRKGRTFHAKPRSWHIKDRTFHRKPRSWHIKGRTFHAKPRSWHIKGRTFHRKPRSWHVKGRTFHAKPRSWHIKGRTFHRKPRSWHVKGRTFHAKPRSWHIKGRTFHKKPRSWHTTNRSFHKKPRSWHTTNRSFHKKPRSWHTINRSFHKKPRSWHTINRSFHKKPRSWHTINRSFHKKPRSWHTKGRSFHSKARSSHVKSISSHNRARSAHKRVRSLHRKVRSSHAKNRSAHNRARSAHNRVRSAHRKARSSHAKNRSAHNRARSAHNRVRSSGHGHSKTRSSRNLPRVFTPQN